MPIEIKVRKIKPTEKKKIENLLRKKCNSRVSERARIIELASKGKRLSEIEKILQRNIKTIRRWIKRFNEEGIEGLEDKERSGRAKIKEEVRTEVLELMEKKPKEVEEYFASWTLEGLQDKLLKVRGVKISTASISRILHKAGWRYRSTRCLYESDAPSKEEKYRRLVEIAKEILGENFNLLEDVVLSLDESHWNLKPSNNRVWTPPNKRQVCCDIPKNKCDSFTTFGALNIYTGQILFKITHWGYAEYFRHFLYQIKNHYKGKRVHIILDNASIHTAEMIEKFIEKHPCVKLYYLLPRGSEVNPIERFWKYSKDKVKKGKSYQNITNLYSDVRKFFWAYQNGNYKYNSRLTLEKICLKT